MFRAIIVGHDHQAGGQDALALARQIADATGADIVVAGVIPVGMMPAESEVVWEVKEREFGDKIRAHAVETDAEARVFHSHSVARGLSDLAEEIGADLIVVGSSRRGKVGQVLAGKVALQVLHGAHCAVAVAPVGYAEEPHALDSVVVGVDGAEESQAAARAAAELATALDADTTLIAVLEPPPVVYGKGGGGMGGIHEVKAAQREQLQRSLDRAAGAFGTREPETKLTEGDPVDALCAAATDSSLLVIGSRGHGPIGRVLLGSTDSKLLDSAPSPMLVWPRRAKAPSASEAAAPTATD